MNPNDGGPLPNGLSEWPQIGWTYVAEGGANIVVSHPDLRGFVVRLAKNHAGYSQHVHRRFLMHVFDPLIGSCLCDAGSIQLMSPALVQSIQSQIQAKRPVKRLALDLSTDSTEVAAWLVKDCRFLALPRIKPLIHGSSGLVSSICVEIKPKCGLLSLFNDTNEGFLPNCRFCLQKCWAHAGKGKPLSDYCPLQLYSDKPDQVVSALSALTRTPQNNLRIMVNEKIVYSEELSHTQAGVVAAQESIRQFLGVDSTLECFDVLKQLIAQGLLQSQVLKKLKDVQNGCVSRIDDVNDAFERLLSFRKASGSEGTYNGMDDLLWPAVTNPSKGAAHCGLANVSDIELLRNFAAGMTANDCSLMMTFSSIKNYAPNTNMHNTIKVDGVNGSFGFNVRVVDVDLKSCTKIRSYVERTVLLTEFYREGAVPSCIGRK